MQALREALRKRRMEKLGGMEDSLMQSPATEHEQEDKGSDLAPSSKHVAANTAHEDKDNQKLLNPGQKQVVSQTAHTASAQAQDDDGADEMAMMAQMMKGMSDEDMQHSMQNKPKTLGERVRQSVLMKRK